VKLKGIAVLAVCGVLALMAVPSSPVAAAVTARTYPVASVSKTFIDASRSTPPNGTYRGSSRRTLATLILYPQQPAGQHRQFPLVVFSHGFTADGPSYAAILLRAWAAHGYVIAAPTFPLSSGEAHGGPTILDYVNQPGDVSFVITKMLELDHRKNSPVDNLIDANRIGVAGHSLGAITTLGVADNSCCQDPRIDAAVSIAGLELPFPGGTYFTGHDAPLLLVHGTADKTIPYGSSQRLFADAQSPKFFLTLEGAPHTPFFGAWGSPVTNTVLAFLDRYLGHGHGTGQIVKAGTVPGVSSIQVQLNAGNQAAA
jgi:predicted dienelactone hydrolase